MLDKQRALICAGVFLPRRRDRRRPGGDGSQAAPWNWLQGFVSSTRQPGYSYPTLSMVPHDHYPQKNAQGARIYADGANRAFAVSLWDQMIQKSATICSGDVS